ncbi:MAG TPA: hypothetical protein VN784_10665 [Candidatus Limnocylindrales bacterium]|nr:hypothetical protein [Candidatus Limnocylindrales bacterium]
MANKQDYLARLQVAIQRLHDCGANYRETVPVQEVFQGKTIWQGEVEVFDLYGHDQAKICYGWSHREGKDDKGERFVTVLQRPPVISPETAVKVAIAAEVKEKK